MLLFGVDLDHNGIASRFGMFINSRARKLFGDLRIDYIPGVRVTRFLESELERKKLRKAKPDAGEFMKIPTFTR